MKLAIIAVGQAGGKITDKFLEYQKETGDEIIKHVLAVNTAEADLMGLEHVPNKNRVLIGQDIVKGSGVGADNELGAEVMEKDIRTVTSEIDSVPVHRIDAFMVISALGGGTGSGGAPVLAKHLKRTYTEPVYSVSVVPGKNEGGIYSRNAAKSFQTAVNEFDNVILIDNDSLRSSGESIREGYEEINERIVQRLAVLFNAGETKSNVGESVVDSSEIINTLESGGVSTIGYSSSIVKDKNERGLLSRFKDKQKEIGEQENVNQLTSLVRKATLNNLSMPAEIKSTQKGLITIAGPSRWLSRKGIEKSRKWLEEETGSMEIRGGDYPIESEDKVAAVVLLSGLTNIPRIKELQRIAVEAKDKKEQLENKQKEELEELVKDSDEQIDPLF